jgi:hypothetical protein
MDVCLAFLGALLEEESYVTLPPGYRELTGTTGTAKGVKLSRGLLRLSLVSKGNTMTK